MLFAVPDTALHHQPDGTAVLASRQDLGPYASSVTELFRASAATAPERVLVAQRTAEGWRRLTYGAARAHVDALAQALLDRRLGPRPVMMLSGNSIEHLVVALAAHTVGVPFVPVSTAYSLLSPDHGTLRAMAELTNPGLVVADDGTAYAAATAAVTEVAPGCTAVMVESTVGDRPGNRPSNRPGNTAVTPLGELLASTPTGEVEQRAAEVGPDTVARIMFTSGSTGRPKGVLTTHGMLCANQQMIRQVWSFLAEEPPVLLDWLPWSHTFGGSHNTNMVLAFGGTLWIDEGRPTSIGATLRNLRDISPTVYFNVPAGYAALVPALEADRSLAESFFARLRVIFCAAAALPQQLWDRIGALAAALGSRAAMTTAWGVTETAPAATVTHFATDRSDCIGVPLPGVRIRLVPVGDKTEIRVAGPNVTPGYRGNPEQTAAAFDEQGYYRTGDAVRLIDEHDPNAGLRFDGRIAEDFKLATGTWVSVGTLRPALLDASAGLLRDAVLTGHDGPWVGAMVWLAEPAPADPVMLRAALSSTLDRHNATAVGSSQRVLRLLVLTEPPSLADGEITDKGYVNQRAVLQRRATLVQKLHAEPAAPDVICWPGG